MQYISLMKIWHHVIGKTFFPKYAPKVKNYQHKMRGKNGRGNPVDFSEEDVKHIMKGIDKMYKDLKKAKP